MSDLGQEGTSVHPARPPVVSIVTADSILGFLMSKVVLGKYAF